MSKKAAIFMAAMLAGTGGAGLSQSSADQSAQAQPVPPALVLREFEGIVVAAASWGVAAPIEAQIKRLHFIEGQLIRKGDLLVEFNDVAARFEAELARAELEQKQVELAQAEDVFNRQQLLKERQTVSVAAYNDAEFRFQLAEIAVQRAKLHLAQTESYLAAHRILAPADGVISRARLHEGMIYDSVMSPEIANIVQLDPIHVRIMLPLKQVLTRLRAGSYSVEDVANLRFGLLLSDGTQSGLVGHVDSVGFGVDPETGEGSVLIGFPNPNDLLRPGLRVELRLLQTE